MVTVCVELIDDKGDPGQEEEEPVTDLADLLKKELKYEKMRKEVAMAKDEEGGAEGEVRGGADGKLRVGHCTWLLYAGYGD